MDVKVDARKYQDIECDALTVAVYEDEKASEGWLAALDQLTGGTIASLIETGEFTGKSGDLAYLPNPGNLKARRLLLLGAGKESEFDAHTTRKLAGTATRALTKKKARTFALVLRGTNLGEQAQAAAEGAIISTFEPNKYHTSDKPENKLDELILAVAEGTTDGLSEAAARGRLIAEAMNWGRDVINEPSNLMTPTNLAVKAEEVAEVYGLTLDVLDEKQMKELGMGSLLGVAQGSAEPPRMIVLTYKSTIPSDETIAIVGKGVTFDTGGISIKPADGMEKMKYDMAGGATTLIAMRAIAQLKPSVNVLGIVPAVENMPGSKAQRPGDVVTAMTGKTIEVINTDAEGRLILADAVAYARKLGATKIVDLATLTGAVSIALGDVYVAILGNNQEWIDDIIGAGKATGEKLWQLPLDKEYREQIKSEIADIKNVGGRKAGTITGAYFIREFVEDTPWAHLDIAGTAWNDSNKPHLGVGPTAVCVRTLVKLVCG